MAKLTRPAQNKVFGSSALSAELTVFGGSTPSTNIDDILNSTEAQRGWGTVGVNGFPPMEWFNALGYGLSYYAAYLLQQGIAEWVATQDYYVNSRAIGSDGKEYKSLTGTSGTPNTGNDPVSDAVNWIDSFKAQVPTAINTSTAKTTPVDADQVGLVDSAASNVLKKVTWANIKATILSSFGVMIGTATAKTTPVDSDIFIIGDSAASNASKKVTWANIKTVLNSVFAPLNSPAFTGSPTAPTRASSDNSTKLATTAFVKNDPSTAKAWVNFNAVPLSGTYSQVGTDITVTMTAHGMSTGMITNLDFTSGTATDGTDFVVTVTGANTFTVVGETSVTTSGNVTRNNYIRSAYNVSSITDNGIGTYKVNHALGNNTYVVIGLQGGYSGNLSSMDVFETSETYAIVRSQSESNGSLLTLDLPMLNVVFYA